MTDDPQYELVMPFVVVEGEGGPFDDVAYTAGVEFGSILRLLWTVHPEVQVVRSTVRTANVPQMDLAAMYYGFTLSTEEWEDDPEWSFATFERGSDVDE